MLDGGAYWLHATAAFVVMTVAPRSSGSASASTARRTRRSLPRSRPAICAAATSPSTRCRGGSPARSGRLSAGSSSPRRRSRSGRSRPAVCVVALVGARCSSAACPQRYRRIPRGEPRAAGARLAAPAVEKDSARRMANMPVMPVLEDPLEYRCRACLASGAPAHAISRRRRRRRRSRRPLSSAQPASPGSTSTRRR